MLNICDGPCSTIDYILVTIYHFLEFQEVVKFSRCKTQNKIFNNSNSILDNLKRA